MNAHDFIIGPTDTDSISFCKADMSPMAADEVALLVNELNELSPDFMEWSDDGYYDACLVLKAKNYVLYKNGKYTYRGSGLRDNKKEPALREMLHRMVEAIIQEQSYQLVDIYHEYIKEALSIKDISRWAVKKTVTKAVLEPDRTTEQKILNALHEAKARGILEGWQEGEKIWLYDAINGQVQAMAKGEKIFYKDGRPKMIPNEMLRDIRLWRADQNDYNQIHYVTRVYDTTLILANVIDHAIFTDYSLKSNRPLLEQLAK